MENAGVIVVMGVSGSGKSTVGRQLAEALGAAFLDADDLHPVENVAKMAAGQPLTDEDRAPWLARVAAEADAIGGEVVVACSALRRRYRDALRGAVARPMTFVHLDGDRDVLAARLAARAGHFMPASLLDSQLETLEPLEPDERGFAIGIAEDPAELVAAIADRLARMAF